MVNADEEMALGYLIDPCFELTNTAGKPLTDGWINVYVHGTRNKYYCYSDWNGNLHPFNIPLDGLGSNVVLASPQFTYDVYVYNKYGTLQMSRYNVSPVGVGDVSVSGINTIISTSETVQIDQYGDTFDLSVPEVTAFNDMKEAFEEMTDVVTGMQVTVDELASAVSGKKDKQEPYSFSETNRYTVSSLSQNADGKVSMGSTKSVGSEYTVVHSGTTSNKFAKIAEFPCYSGFSWVGSGFTNLVVSVSDAGGARQAMISVGLTQAANGNHNFAAPLRYYVSVNQSSTMELKKVYLFSDTPYGNSQVQATISLWAEFTDLTQKQWTFKAENNYATPGTGGTPKANAWEFANGQRYPVSALPTDGWQLNSQDPMYATQTPDWDETSPSSRSFIRNKPDLTQYVSQEELATAVSSLSVQSDWEQSDSTKPDYIKNKPNMADYVTQEELVTAVSGLGVQSDWTEQDSDSPAYIQNKPVSKELVAGDNVNIVVTGTSVIINADVPEVSGFATEVELATVSGALQLEIETVSANPRVKTVEYGVDRWTDVVAAMDGVSSGKYDYVVMKYTSNGIDLYAPLIKYEAGSSAFFACPAHVSDTVPGYGERRATEIFIINSGDMWFDRTIRPFQGKLIGRGNVSITVQGEDYVVSGADSTFEQVNSDWEAVSGVAEILNKPEEIGLYAGNNITITTTGASATINAVVPDVSNFATETELAAVSGNIVNLIPDVTDFATHDEVNTVSGAIVSLIPEVVITPSLASGTKIADYSIDGVSGQLFAPNGGGDTSNIFWVVDGVTSYNDVYAAFNQGKTILIRDDDGIQGIRVGTLLSFNNWSDWSFVFGYPEATHEVGQTGYGADYRVKWLNRDDGWETTGEIFNFNVQADWNQSNSIAPDYINNKPHIPEIELNSGDQVTAIDGYTIAGGGSSTYTAGDHIDISNDTISVTGITDLVAGNAITITSSGSSAIISSTGEAQVQSDWDEDDPSSKAYILNKPEIPTYTGASGINISNDVISLDNPVGLVAGNNITIEVTGVSAIISSTGGGGGGSYSAGTGIDITNNVISVDNTVAMKTDIVEYTAGDNIDITNDTISVTGTSDLIAGDNITITASGTDFVISSTGGGSTYTAASGIDITNDVISAKVDGTTMGINASGCLVSNKKYVDLTYNSSTWADFTAAYTKLQNGEIDGIRVANPGINATFYADYVFSENYRGTPTNATFVAPAFAARVPSGYNRRMATRIYTLTADGTWTSEYSYSFDGQIIAGANVTVTASGADYIISSTGGGGGGSYSAGTGIDITGTTISVDNTVAMKTDIVEYTAGSGIDITNNEISVSGVMMENPYFGIDNQGYATRYSPGTVTETIGQLSGTPMTMVVLDDATYTMPCSGYTGEIKLYRGTQWDYSSVPSRYPTDDQLVFTKSDFTVISTGDYWVYFVNPGSLYGNNVTVTYSTSASPTRYLLSSAGITDIQVVNAVSACIANNVLYLIPEA